MSAPWGDLRPASRRASSAARGASRKANTACEAALRFALRRIGVRAPTKPHPTLPGRPDLAFLEAHVAVFCDGDFWHGRNLRSRLAKLHRGHNADYWVAKLSSNVARDKRVNRELRKLGFIVLRYWESDIRRATDEAAAEIARTLWARRFGRPAILRSRPHGTNL